MREQTQDRMARQRALVFACLFLLVLIVAAAVFESRLSAPPQMATQHLLGRLRSANLVVNSSYVFGFFAVGAIGGLVGGMLGAGAGVLQVAGLLLVFKMDITFARTVSMATMFLAALAALPQCPSPPPFQQRSLQLMVLPALGGTAGGLILGFVLRGPTLTHLFGVFVLFLSLYTLALTLGDPDEVVLRHQFRQGEGARHGQFARPTGFVHGFCSGLLGISGAVITTPMQQIFLHVPVHQAIASSLRLTALCAGLGSIVVTTVGIYRGDFRWKQLLLVFFFAGIGAIIGGQVGVRLSGRVNSCVLRLIFVAVTLIAGFSILL